MTTKARGNQVEFSDVIVEDAPEVIEEIPFTETEPELPPGPRRRAGKLSKELETLYATAGTAIYPFNPRVGAIVVQQSKSCAESLDELARTNPAVRRTLERMLTTSSWSAVIAAHLPIMVAVATEYVPYVRDNYNAAFSEEQPA